jgi:spermidine/putrescine-binding protein
MPNISRRHFHAGLGAAAILLSVPRAARAAGLHLNVGVISDEISQDLDHAC